MGTFLHCQAGSTKDLKVVDYLRVVEYMTVNDCLAVVDYSKVDDYIIVADYLTVTVAAYLPESFWPRNNPS